MFRPRVPGCGNQCNVATPVTGAEWALRLDFRDAYVTYLFCMTLTDRDRKIVQLVARFSQASVSDVHALLFAHNESRTPCDRALQRLTLQTYLRRVERRAIGGRQGGSGQFVYCLGKAGHREYGRHVHKDGTSYIPRYNPKRKIDYHALGIMETFRIFTDKARVGEFDILGYTTEQNGDAWQWIGPDWLQPDLYIELGRDGKRRQYYIEVDMATESHGHIIAKYQRYWRACKAGYDTDAWPKVRRVMFAAIDEERAAELQWLLRRVDSESHRIFDFVAIPTLRDLVL